jgi:hypothetical protein
MSKWNTEGSTLVEIFAPNQDSSFWTDDAGDLPDFIDAELKRLIPIHEAATTYELEITFQSKGYYHPGVTVGPPERWYPPEGADERTVTRADVFCVGECLISDVLSADIYNDIYDRWEAEINDADIDTDEDDYYDDYGDDDF